MAVTVTVIRQGASNRSTHIADVIADDNADVAAVIPHGLGVVPQEVELTGLQAAARVSLWFVFAIDATNVEVRKAGGVGGVAGAQVRVVIRRPHSLGR
jgi:hypothetical protein